MEEKLISDIIRLHDISFTEDVLWDTVLNAIPKKFKGMAPINMAVFFNPIFLRHN